MAGFKLDTSELVKGVSDIQLRMNVALGVYAETASKMLESHAKKNYPWTDRTYRASKGIRGDFSWVGSTLRVTLESEVDYSLYLEFCNEGKYAIIWPTINAKSPEIMKGLRNLLG